MNIAAFYLKEYINSRISSDYGMRWHPLSGQWRMHNGVDYVFSPRNAVMKSPVDGVIRAAEYFNSRGNTVSVKVKGQNELILLQHLASMKVKPGDAVKMRDPLGVCGTTGDSTGEHLHLEVKVDDGSKLGGRVWGSPHDYVYTGGVVKPSTKFIEGDTVTTTAIPHQNIREKPTVASKIAGQLKTGATALIVDYKSVWADGYYWWHTEWGWVAERWLELVQKDIPDEPIIDAPKDDYLDDWVDDEINDEPEPIEDEPKLADELPSGLIELLKMLYEMLKTILGKEG